MRQLKIAVDVDMTVVDMLPHWAGWFEKEVGVNPDFKRQPHDVYYLTDKLKALAASSDFLPGERSGFYPNAFWKQGDLYQSTGVMPIPGSQDAIMQWKDSGHEVFFATMCNDSHIKSKREFLAEHFPGVPMVSIDRKEFVDADVLIEDNPSALNNFKVRNPAGKALYFNGCYIDAFAYDALAEQIINLPDGQRYADICSNWAIVNTMVLNYSCRPFFMKPLETIA